MESIRAKAWLEAQLENVTNQNLMTKADSILEYSCFNFFRLFPAEYVGPILSEFQGYGPLPGHDLASLDRALETAVLEPLITYLDGSFEHDFLGDRWGEFAGLPGPCVAMRNTWHRAKCANFLEADHDGFFSFEQHAGLEVRQLPDPCTEPPDWDANIDVAYRDAPWWPGYAEVTIPISEMVTYLLDPEVCGEPRSPGHVVVRSYPEGEFEDAICTNPGCIYDGAGACIPH